MLMDGKEVLTRGLDRFLEEQDLRDMLSEWMKTLITWSSYVWYKRG